MSGSDGDLSTLADYVYRHVFLQYTIKQWGLSPEQVESSVTARVPVYISKDDRYFQDKYQGIPSQGYTSLIQNILNHKNIRVQLGSDFKEVRHDLTFERLFYSGCIDEFYDYCFGVLPYRSINFQHDRLNKAYYQGKAVINYPNNYDFTRITEFKHFLNEKSAHTHILFEFPESFIPSKNEPLYPVESAESRTLYQKYKELSREENGVYFLGRLGDYRYYNMDAAVERAFELYGTLSKKEG